MQAWQQSLWCYPGCSQMQHADTKKEGANADVQNWSLISLCVTSSCNQQGTYVCLIIRDFIFFSSVETINCLLKELFWSREAVKWRSVFQVTLIYISLPHLFGNLEDKEQTQWIANICLSCFSASSTAPHNWLVCINQSSFAQRDDLDSTSCFPRQLSSCG